MGLFDWLSGKKRDIVEDLATSIPTPTQDKVLATISEVNPAGIPEGITVVAESKIPASCNLGNLNFEKNYQKAIDEGLKLLEQTPNDVGVHINLMVSYFKARDIDPTYLDKCTYHAKQAILYGHNTGYAEDRLIKNLIKAKLFHQAVQLCDIVLMDDFQFSAHAMGNKEEYVSRRAKLILKLPKSLDTASDSLFTPEEIKQIIQSIKDNDERERLEQFEWHKKK